MQIVIRNAMFSTKLSSYTEMLIMQWQTLLMKKVVCVAGVACVVYKGHDR